MIKDKLTQLMRKYEPIGLVKGGELLLTPNDALRLADDLEAIGIAIMGSDGWCYVDQEKGLVAQDLAVDFYVGDDVLYGEDSVQRSVAKIKEFITNQIPERVAFVSFTLDIPNTWDLPPDRLE